MTKLSQLLAIEKGVRSSVNSEVTRLYHDVQKPPLLSGITRTYQPKDDDGDTLPPESTLVQLTVADVLDGVAKQMTRLFDVVLTKDSANMEASADITVDGKILAKAVPVPYLLFLEKQLTDLHTVLSKLPILDPAEEWHRDDNNAVFKTTVAKTTRSKKVMRNHQVAKPTDKHPEQVQVYTEDVIVGTWDTTKLSGAVPASRRAQLVERVEQVQEAVKFAREAANGIEIKDREVGKKLFDFVLGE